MKTIGYKPKDANGRKRLSMRKDSDSGFTLIELLVVVIIMGVLATISAPSWFGFVQQRRVNASYNFFLQKVQEAQSTARKKKLEYTVSFRYYNGIPEVAIYPADFEPTDVRLESYWRAPEGLREKEVLIQTNLTEDPNLVQDPLTVKTITEGQFSKRRLTFDATGVLKERNNMNFPIAIVLAAPRSANTNLTQSASATKRCVMIRTLLGGISPGRRLYDETNNPTGCPKDG